jgi:hypothetical protein
MPWATFVFFTCRRLINHWFAFLAADSYESASGGIAQCSYGSIDDILALGGFGFVVEIKSKQ